MNTYIDFKNILNEHNSTSYFNYNYSIHSELIFDSTHGEIPELTICIPTYNRPDRLFTILDLIQSYKLSSKRFNILICDNNPLNQHNQDRLITSFQKYKFKIQYYVNSKNIGMFENWNRSIFLSKSKWVSLLHDDDILIKDFFLRYEELIGRFSNYNIIANSYKIIQKNEINEISLSSISKSKVNYTFLKPIDNFFIGSNVYGAPTCGVLLNKSFFESHGGFIVNEKFYPSNDHFSFYKLNMHSTFVLIDLALGYYVLDINTSLDKQIIIKATHNNFQFRKYLNTIYFHNEFFKKIIFQGTNDNLYNMIKHGRNFSDLEKNGEFVYLLDTLPKKINLLFYKIILKCYRFFKKIRYF